MTEPAPTRAVILAARRTPIATVGRRLAHARVEELAAAALAACVADARAALGGAPAGGLPPATVTPAAAPDAAAPVADVILGNCMGPGGNTARLALLAAGIGVETPGMTVDRQCGSGLAAIDAAARAIAAGERGMILAGGAESASTAPERIAPGGLGYARAAFAPEGFPDPEMGPAAQALADARGIGRDRQDAYAARSHRSAMRARAAGAFEREWVAIPASAGDGGARPAEPEPADRVEDGPRPPSAAVLARFAPVFAEGGTVTAGNSCRVSDGAAAVALVPEDLSGGAPGLIVRGTVVIGVDPALPGIGPAPAIRLLLEREGVRLEDVAAIELVEAFAAQALAVLDELGLAGEGREVDPRVCADGGALALGHPWGASGAVSVVRLFSRLVAGGAPAGSLGLAAAAIGGGMGIAMLVEVRR